MNEKMLINPELYLKICSIVYEVLDKMNSDVSLTVSCAAIHLLAKEIIEENFKDIKVNFYCGTVIYNLNGLRLSYDYKEDVLWEDESLGNWHAFLILEKENEKYFIDFMSPLFDEVFSIEEDFIPRKMFQKNINKNLSRIEFSKSNFLNTSSGDFYFEIEKDLTKKITNNQSTVFIKNFGVMLNEWYRNGKNKIIVKDNLGNQHCLVKAQIELSGVW